VVGLYATSFAAIKYYHNPFFMVWLVYGALFR
jgi:hypothetical protein